MKKVAIIGTRGVPASYGGFETFAEELGIRLAALGWNVTVYGRKKIFSKSQPLSDYKGVKRINAGTIFSKYLETPLSAFTAFWHAVFKLKPEIILLCNNANAIAAWLAIFSTTKLFINVDGIERKRAKWGIVGKLGYLLGEYCAVKFADKIIADAEVIKLYYRHKHKTEAAMIAYGARYKPLPAGATLTKYLLTPRQYFIYVARLEPENNALGVIEAFERAQVANPQSTYKLVIVGDAPYGLKYKKLLKERASDRVVFTGFLFGDPYFELLNNAFAYIRASEVGGTHPALLEAMTHGLCVIANDVPQHREVLADTGIYYPFNDFAKLSEILLNINSYNIENFGIAAKQRADLLYSWDKITAEYVKLFSEK
ncbi:MAG TPA: DUF1972 domain-containing protein [Oligoflexia bacterium]|nr:DUF1972 domain-containing protein [Oligoflexia bacterium]HMP27712.1 DUF1972 domain-containing protein [Oligoflexia bacterium]